ncbi:MAG: ATP-binding cassette domain-containing protein [Verrucomicrobia bacterium]|nr:ATP-binding cassette domain-containing protein [Verrucomicrobiota bacterium]MBT7067225.1 ATP-binding cassette domain-containing protein [Verrucomicrobiota bacterium]MBT7699006.1 ATP-binding cassette domain-containing protein [Verrucomicrobiota bacterium]
MERDKLPQPIAEAVAARYPDEPIRLAISSDIAHHGQYGTEWLVATGGHLLVFPGDSATATHDLALSDLEELKAVDTVGAGAVTVRTPSATYHVISYTEARSDDFHKVVDGIKALKEGEAVTEHHTVSDRKRCEQCGRAIPESMRACPHCLKRRQAVLRIFSFSRPYIWQIAAIFLISSLSTMAALLVPYMSKLFIDFVFRPDAESGTFPHGGWHLWCVAAIFVAYALQSFFSGWQERLSGVVGFKTVYDVRAAIYKRIQELSLTFFDKRHTGSIMARVNQDTGELQRLLVDFIPISLESLLSLVGVGILLFVVSWRLTLFVMLPIAGTILLLRLIVPVVRVFFHRYFHRRSRLSALVNDSLSGIRVVKSFGQETLEMDKFRRTSQVYRDAGIDLVRRWSIYHPLMHFTIMCGAVLVWLVGGRLVFRGTEAPGGLSIGDVVAYSGYLMMFYRPVFMLTRLAQMITNALTAADRVFDIIDTTPDIQDAPDAVAMPHIEGHIALDNVTFGYTRHQPVIKELTLDIPANSMIGLVGKSGAGKSTLINLMSRLYDVDSGALQVDGVDVRQIRQADLRRNIGVVLQETFLFTGSILQNISYAKPDATREEVIAAAISAHAHEFIISKVDGYDTLVGERGSRLSGGEKQRIAIARAILRNPRILILDEATSSVDVETEEKIQQALANLTRGRTTIAIAHRLATLRNCDQLVVIEDGEISEMGTHKELMQKEGAFSKLVQSQEAHSTIIAVEG